MAKYHQYIYGEWEWPVQKGYMLSCCDCGKVHRVDFRIIDGHVEYRMFDAPRSTGQIRRHMHAMTPTEHAERVISHYLCLRELPPKVIKSIKARIAFEIKAYGGG